MTKPRLWSIVKWIGLYLLANIIGGVLAFTLGVRGYDAAIAAAILVIMIVAAVLKRKKGVA